MADIFVRELGDMLVTDDLSEGRTQNELPSPNDLKRKIILKGKIKQKKKVSQKALFNFEFEFSIKSCV